MQTWHRRNQMMDIPTPTPTLTTATVAMNVDDMFLSEMDPTVDQDSTLHMMYTLVTHCANTSHTQEIASQQTNALNVTGTPVYSLLLLSLHGVLMSIVSCSCLHRNQRSQVMI